MAREDGDGRWGRGRGGSEGEDREDGAALVGEYLPPPDMTATAGDRQLDK